MTALSWFFGKKKDDKPIPVTVEAVEVGNDEDYAIIQANTRGIYPQVNPTPYPNSHFYAPLPYSVTPQGQSAQFNQQSVSEQVRTTGAQNQLDGVPFVLSPALDQGANKSDVAGLEDLRRAVFQIAADINDSMYDYNFKLEHTILHEASIYKNDN